MVLPKRKVVQTVSNGFVPKCIIKKDGFVAATPHAVLLHVAEQPTLMKTWIYVCSQVFSVTQKNGMTLIKYEQSYNVPSIISKTTCALLEEKQETIPPQNLIIYVNSETILNTDLFSPLIYGRVIHSNQ